MFHVTVIEFVCVIKGKYDIPEILIFFIDDKCVRIYFIFRRILQYIL